MSSASTSSTTGEHNRPTTTLVPSVGACERVWAPQAPSDESPEFTAEVQSVSMTYLQWCATLFVGMLARHPNRINTGALWGSAKTLFPEGADDASGSLMTRFTTSSPQPARGVIADSWRRARLSGLSPSSTVDALEADDYDTPSRLLHTADPVLNKMAAALDGSHYCVMLADRDARIVATRGAPRACDACSSCWDRHCTAPFFGKTPPAPTRSQRDRNPRGDPRIGAQ